MPPTETRVPAVYKVADVAALLDMGVRQTYEAIKRGEIQGCHKLGKSVRCSKVAVDQWLNRPQPTRQPSVDRLEMYR
jgi:excisionase family DNA binding protein